MFCWWTGRTLQLIGIGVRHSGAASSLFNVRHSIFDECRLSLLFFPAWSCRTARKEREDRIPIKWIRIHVSSVRITIAPHNVKKAPPAEDMKREPACGISLCYCLSSFGLPISPLTSSLFWYLVRRRDLIRKKKQIYSRNFLTRYS